MPEAKSEKIFWNSVYLIIGCLGISLLIYSIFRKLEGDELEALYSSYHVSKGAILYKELFQHHHPFLYYLLSPIFWLFGATTLSLKICRLCTFGIFLATTFTTFLISKLVCNKQTAFINVIVLWSVPLFYIHGIEVRPDTPQVLFCLLSVLFFFRYLKKQNLSDLIISALSLGIGFLSFQKAIAFIALLGLLFIYNIATKQLPLSSIFLYGAVALSPISIYIGYLFYNNLWNNYFFYNWVYNLQAIRNIPLLFSTLIYTYQTSIVVWFFFFIGGCFLLKNNLLKQVFFLGTGFLSFLFLYPLPFHQYVYPALPLVSIISAHGLYILFQRKKMIVLASLLFMAIPPTLGHIVRRIKISPSTEQYKKIDYVLSIANLNESCIDSNHQTFNLFWKTPYFCWFDTPHAMSMHQRLKDTHYKIDIFGILEKQKPKVIGQKSIEWLADTKVENIADKRFTKHYKRDNNYPDLFIRK